MTFLHVTLLAGLALASIPVLLHLTSKKPPQKLIFPALRFVRQTAVTSERGWKAKHWLLMALRALLVGLAAFALAAPRVHSEMLASFLSIGMMAGLALLATAAAMVSIVTRKSKSILITTCLVAAVLWLGVLGWGGYAITKGKMPLVQATSGPIAAAIVVDTSPTMDYRSSNQTRLEVAKEMGAWLIDRLPPESQIAIVTTEQGLRLSPDRITAERQLSRVLTEGKAAPLRSRIEAATELVRNSKLERREVYILTDLMSAAWRDLGDAQNSVKGVDPKGVLVQIVDVGVDKTQNFSLVDIKLSQQVVSPGGSVDVEGSVLSSSQTPDQQVTVELWTEPIDRTLPLQKNGKTVTAEPSLIERQILEVPSGNSAKFRFTLRGLKRGTNHVHLKLGQPDPIGLDNVAHVAIEVREQGKALVVSDDRDLGSLLVAMVDPSAEIRDGKSSRCDQVDPFRLETVDFASYSSVLFLDPPGLTSTVVERLSAFVDSGGGVLFLLGHRLGDPSKANSLPIAKLLPGAITQQFQSLSGGRETNFAPVLLSHPILHPLEKLAEDAPWALYPVSRHWVFEKLNENASTIIRYTKSGFPAIIDENRGAGKIVTWTTPIPEPTSPEGRDPWNQLWNATDDPWPNFALMIGSIRYLSGWGKNQLNYAVGQIASLENYSGDPESYELFAPDDEMMRVTVTNGNIMVPLTRRSGHYRLRSVGAGESRVRGFAVNVMKEDLLLDRVPIESLESTLGKGMFRVARQKNEVESSVGEARFGSELYPFLMLIAALLVISEQAMSSRFYTIRL